MTGAAGIAAPSLAPFAATLVGVADAAIDHGLAHGAPPTIDTSAHPEALQDTRAAFVTLLDAAGELRGCVGSLEAHRPLVTDISDNAFAAAFQDPRFPPVTPAERAALTCKVSVLTPPEPMAFDSEAHLVSQLEPGLDGVLLEVGELCRGTLLPAVWEHLPDPVDFWLTLKRKAGLAPDAFPPELTVYRYRAESLG